MLTYEQLGWLFLFGNRKHVELYSGTSWLVLTEFQPDTHLIHADLYQDKTTGAV